MIAPRRMLPALLVIAMISAPATRAQDTKNADRPESRSKIADEAGMFSKSAVEAANRELASNEKKSSVPVVIETVESLKGEPIEEATLQAARRSGGQGVFVLIAKNEKKLYVLTRRQFDHRLPADKRNAIRDAFLAGFKAGNFDEGLSKGVSEIGSTLMATADKEPLTPLVERDRIRLTLAGAKRALEAAEKKAAELNLKMNIAVVDDGGHLLTFARMDGARPASASTAQTKAISAATMRQATGPIPANATSPDLLVNLGLAPAAASGGARVTTLYGGIPIVIDGQVVGAVGVGGGSGEQDAEVARAGAAALANESRKAEGK